MRKEGEKGEKRWGKKETGGEENKGKTWGKRGREKGV